MITVIFGKIKHGKSTYCKEIVRKSIIPVVIIDSLDEHEDVAIKMRISDYIRFDKFKIRFVPDTNIDFDILNRLLSQIHYKYGMNVIVDEVDLWTDPHFIPHSFWRNLKFSRHYKLHLYVTVRNPNAIHKSITALADTFIIHRITEPSQLDYFKRHHGSLVNHIKSLKRFDYIIYDLDKEDIEIVKKARI